MAKRIRKASNNMIEWVRTQQRTGSRFIGGAHKNSDYNYVCTAEDFLKVVNQEGRSLCDFDCIIPEESIPITGIYTFSDGQYFLRLIVVPEKIDLKAWKYATNGVYLLPDSIRAKSKKRRLEVFNWYLNDFYAMNGAGKRKFRWPDPMYPNHLPTMPSRDEQNKAWDTHMRSLGH